MEVSVLQWNIWGLEDVKNVVSFLKANPTDIVCLQELTIGWPGLAIQNTPSYVADQLGLDYYSPSIPLMTDSGQAMFWSNGIYSRYPIKHKSLVWTRQPATLASDNEQCAYIEVLLQIGEQAVTVGATRLAYEDKHKATLSKKAETDRLLQSLAKHSQQFIFTGDLNALPGSYTINKIGSLLKHAGPDFEQKTWTTKPFSYQGFEATELNWRLDYVFVTPDIEVVSAEILSTEYSDHLPVLVKIKI